MSFMKSIKGFTLIELVMVIVILGIIASVVLPKFVNFKTQAIERQEDAVIGALNTAIKITLTSYITAGGDPTAFIANNPFNFLAQAPANSTLTAAEVTLVPDGTTWRIWLNAGTNVHIIYCPHWDGPATGGFGTKGRQYLYIYTDNATWRGDHKTGDIWLNRNSYH